VVCARWLGRMVGLEVACSRVAHHWEEGRTRRHQISACREWEEHRQVLKGTVKVCRIVCVQRWEEQIRRYKDSVCMGVRKQ